MARGRRRASGRGPAPAPVNQQLGPARRATRTAKRERRRRRRRFRSALAGTTAVLLVLGFVGFAVSRITTRDPEEQETTPRTQQTLLLQVASSDGSAVAAALVAFDPEPDTASMVLLPAQTVSDAPGYGSLPVGDVLRLAGAAVSRQAVSDLLAGVRVDHDWTLSAAAYIALIDSPFMSAENEIFYGCGALFRSKPPEYFSAIGRFRSALARDPENAVAEFLLGVAYAGYDQPDSARAALGRALALDPGVARTLAPRLAERPALRARVGALLSGAPAPAPAAAPAPAPAAAPAPATAPAPAPAFRPGDVVEVLGSGDAWERGVVVSANDENRDGSLFTYHVRRRLVPKDPATEVVSKVYPPRIRAATAAPPAPAEAPAAPGALVYGAYACAFEYWSGPPAARQRQREEKGSLLLRPDGTYRHYDNGATGRYRYDAATGALTWLSGPLAALRPERTTFRRNRATAQIDIRQRGDYEWSCGTDLP
jgi:hypothetical protein